MCRCKQRRAKLNRIVPHLGNAVAAVTHYTGLDKLVKSMNWAYGITTTPERFTMLASSTLPSLRRAGFGTPRLFIDVKTQAAVPADLSHYPLTIRDPNMGIVGSWMLALWELLMREPLADRYVIFQDDFITYRNLREYLESIPYPADGYLNLYTFPQNEKMAKGRTGFYRSNQLGKGAVALVFDREAAVAIATSHHMVDKPKCPKKGKKSVDGGIVTAARMANKFEYVHNPSLVQHIGDKSSMGNNKHPKSATFKGELFDAMELLSTASSKALTRTIEAKPTPVLVENESPIPKEPETQMIGLYGPCCDTDASRLLWDIAAHDPDTIWMVTPHADRPTLPCPAGVGVVTGRTPQAFRQYFQMVNKVYIIEEPSNPMMLKTARKCGVEVILIERETVGTGTPNEYVPHWEHPLMKRLTLPDWSYTSWQKHS